MEVKQLVQEHTASKRLTSDVNLVPESVFYNYANSLPSKV